MNSLSSGRLRAVHGRSWYEYGVPRSRCGLRQLHWPVATIIFPTEPCSRRSTSEVNSTGPTTLSVVMAGGLTRSPTKGAASQLPWYLLPTGISWIYYCSASTRRTAGSAGSWGSSLASVSGLLVFFFTPGEEGQKTPGHAFRHPLWSIRGTPELAVGTGGRNRYGSVGV